MRILGNQRSVKATASGALIEDQVIDLLNFEKSTRYSERQRAALAYAEAIVWHLNTDDAFWDASTAISPSRSWWSLAA
jgi:alkylhydroperoxidase family enzyme